MANLIMRFPGGLPKALTLSYDDGAPGPSTGVCP